MEWVREAKASGLVGIVLVDGSFVTAKPAPNDIDLIAVVFLVFDVEIIFLYPWASTFSSLEPRSELALLWLVRIMFFLFTTVVAYLYGWRKGVFRFD